MGPYAVVDYNPIIFPLQSRLQHNYHGQPNARVDFIPQSGIFVFGLWSLVQALGNLKPKARVIDMVQ
jgi:hypothetical protein